MNRNPSHNIYTGAAVAQVVERSPEKAGVGGSTPSRGTIYLAVELPALAGPYPGCDEGWTLASNGAPPWPGPLAAVVGSGFS